MSSLVIEEICTVCRGSTPSRTQRFGYMDVERVIPRALLWKGSEPYFRYLRNHSLKLNESGTCISSASFRALRERRAHHTLCSLAFRQSAAFIILFLLQGSFKLSSLLCQGILTTEPPDCSVSQSSFAILQSTRICILFIWSNFGLTLVQLAPCCEFGMGVLLVSLSSQPCIDIRA